jgi:hypothetical protein
VPGYSALTFRRKQLIDKHTLLPRLAILGCLALSLPAYAQFSTPMRDVDNGARQPVNFTSIIVVNVNSQIGTDSTTVTIPAGKRLVIESVSFLGHVGVGEFGFVTINASAGAGTAAGATGAVHVIPLVKLTNTSSDDIIGGFASFRMYADAGSTVTVVYQRGGFSPLENILMSITGHYVNLP